MAKKKKKPVPMKSKKSGMKTNKLIQQNLQVLKNFETK